MTAISPKFSRTGSPVLNMDDAGGNGIGHDIDYIHPLSYAAAVSQLIPRSQLVRVTPKAVSKPADLKDFHTAITNFLEVFC